MFSTVIKTAFMLAASLGNLPAPSRPMPSVRFAPANSPMMHTARYSPQASGAVYTVEERDFMNRINAERVARGLRPLTPDLQLVQVARAHSYDMCARGYFGHFAPAASLRSPMDRYLYNLQSERIPVPNSVTVGENIYYCSITQGVNDVADADQALINSPEHRANILSPVFERIGVGVCRDAKGRVWVTENFLRAKN